MVSNVTSNRSYQLPHASNFMDEDVLRLISALTAIDGDVTALLVSVSGKAPTVHTHAISGVTGLQEALDDKSPVSHGHAVAGLSDVAITAIANGQFLRWNATTGKFENVTLSADMVTSGVFNVARIPVHQHQIADVQGLQDALNNTTSAGHNHNLANLLDVLFTSIADGQFIRWDAATGKFVNVTFDGGMVITGTIPGARLGSHAHALADVTGLVAALTGKAETGANNSITSIALSNTGLRIRDTNASHWLTVAVGSDLTANRTLTIATGDADRTMTLNSDVNISGYFAGLMSGASAGEVRTDLGLGIGVNVQAYSALLSAFAGLSPVADKMQYFTGASTMALADLSAFARTLLDDANAATARATLGAQAASAILSSLAGLTTAADQFAYFSAAGVLSVAAATAYGRSLLAAADSATARTTLGLAIGTNVQAYDVVLQALSGLTPVADRLPYFTSGSASALAVLTTFARSLLDDADAATARATLGLGSAALLTAGTGANNAVQLNASGALPAVSGANLTSLAGANLGALSVTGAKVAASTLTPDKMSGAQSGSAPAVVLRAFARINASSGTPAIANDINVASLTDNGVGDMTVTFSTAMPNASYAVAATCQMTTGANVSCGIHPSTAPTASAFRLLVQQGGSGVDKDYLNVMVAG